MGLQAEHISFRFPKAADFLLRDVSFSAADGCVTVLIGANGVGKTTLLKVLMGLLPGGGEVCVNDRSRESMTRRELARRVSYMPQENAVAASLGVFEVVLLGRIDHLGLKVSREDTERVWTILCLLGLEHLAERPFCTLSGGQRRMVGIAQALVRAPEVLVLDEPTANLDMQHELELLELLRAYARQRGIAVLLTLHDLNMAAQYGDTLVLLRNGVVEREGPPAAVLTGAAMESAYGVRVRIQPDASGVPVLRPVGSLRHKDYHFSD